MKTSKTIKLLFVLISIGLLSCSAIRQSADTPTERLLSAIAKGKNFYSSGETFDGDIVFPKVSRNQTSKSTYITSELVFENCTFTGKFQLRPEDGSQLYFDKEIIFEGCDFKDELSITDATFRSRFQMGGNLCRRTVDLQRNSFQSMCRIDENEVGQDLILQYSKLHENLSLFGNTLGRHLSLQGISVLGKSQLGNTTLHGSIDVSNCHFHENFSLDYAKKGKKLLAGNSKFYSRCYIKDMEDFEYVDFSTSEIFGKHRFTAKHDIIPNMDGTILHRETK